MNWKKQERVVQNQNYHNNSDQILIIPNNLGKMQCLGFYNQFLKDPNLLAHGHIVIKQYLLGSQENRSQTLTNLLCANPPVITLVGNVYPHDVYPHLTEQQRELTRLYLMKLLLTTVNKQGLSGSKNSQNLFAMLKKIHNVEGYSKWLLLYSNLIQNLQPQYFGMFLIKLLSQSDNRIAELSTNLFVYVIQNHQKYNLSTQTLLQIVFYCIKSFSFMRGTDDEQLSKYYDPYENQLVKFVWSNLRTNPLCMRFGLKILTILYAQMEYGEDDDDENQLQQDVKNIQQLCSFGIMAVQQYNRIIANPSYQSEQIQQEQQSLQKASSIQSNIAVIVYQLLQLYDTLFQVENPAIVKSLNLKLIALTLVLAAVPSFGEMSHWASNSEEYMVLIEDETSICLKNRCTQMLIDMLEKEGKKDVYKQAIDDMWDQDGIKKNKKHNKKNKNKEKSSGQLIGFIKAYFVAIAEASRINNNTQAITQVQKFLNSQNYSTTTQIQLALHGQFEAYQQSIYFLFSSPLDVLFPNKQQQKELLTYFLGRCQSSQNIVIKILTLYIYSNHFNTWDENEKKTAMGAILGLVSGFVNNTNGLSKSEVGLMLELARALGKLCRSQKLQINKEVPVQFMQRLLAYLSNPIDKLQETATHIVLQLLIQLTKSSASNKQILSSIFGENLQNHMLNHYMNDILVSDLAIQLLVAYPNMNVINNVVSLLLNGAIFNDKYVQLVVKWLESGLVGLNEGHLQLLLSRYSQVKNNNKADIIASKRTNNNRETIDPIIRKYLLTLNQSHSQSKPSPNLIALLNINPDQAWLVPMIRAGILADPITALLKCIHKITYQITSQYQLETHMILPYYYALHQTNKFMEAIQNVQSSNMPNLLQQFLSKVYKYGELFKGEHLRIVNSLFWLKLCEAEKSLAGQTIKLIEGYGKIQPDQWQESDSDEDQNQQTIMNNLLNRVDNSQVEEQLKILFPDLVWATEVVYQKVRELKERG